MESEILNRLTKIPVIYVQCLRDIDKVAELSLPKREAPSQPIKPSMLSFVNSLILNRLR